MVDPTQYQFFNTLQAMTREGWLTKDLIDTVFRDGKIFKWLRQQKHVVPISGGVVQKWSINVGQSPNTQAFDGLDALNLYSMDANAINAALLTKRYTDALIMPIATIQDNDGAEEAAVGNIVRTQLAVVKASLVKKLSQDVLVNTQAANPKQMNGLAEAVDDGTVATSYAGISRTTYAGNWKSPVNYQSTMAAVLANITTLDLAASTDGERPGAYFGTNAIFGAIQNQLQNFVQYQDGAILQKNVTGYDLVLFGKPFFIDQYLPSGVATPATFTIGGTNAGGYMYGLNPSYIKLGVHKRWNFRASDWDSAEATMAAIFTRLYWSGNLAVLKPSTNWVAWVQGG